MKWKIIKKSQSYSTNMATLLRGTELASKVMGAISFGRHTVSYRADSIVIDCRFDYFK